jgi:hypothetical protein
VSTTQKLLRLERERTRRLSKQIEFERVDIIVLEAGKDHRQEHSYILIETKKRGAPPTQKKDGVDRLKSYMAATLNARYG